MREEVKILVCPACGEAMETVFIPTKNFYVEICVNGCGGIFFDNRELKHFDEQNEDASEILDKFIDKKFEKVDTTKKRICPCCGANMVKNFSSVKKDIEIDECYNCGGKFLDNGELEKIRNEYQNEAERKAHFESVFSKLLEENTSNNNG